MSITLKIDNVEFEYGSNPVLNGVTFNVNESVFLGILGPNGSGKSTLIKTISGYLQPTKGSIYIDDKSIESINTVKLAKKMAMVSQNSRTDFEFTVEEVVLMGRYPYIGKFESETAKDYKVAHWAMVKTNTWNLRYKPIAQLSGGEVQRVLIARALTQQPKIILLDEPTSHLDINYQTEILSLLKESNELNGITVICVLHDVNLASYFCDKILLLKQGRIFAIGTPSDVITEKNISSLYGISVKVQRHPITHKPFITIMPNENGKITNNGLSFHVVCGGGSGSELLYRLKANGFKVSCGVLNISDTDWQTAKDLSLDVVEEAPFAPITPSKFYENLDYMLNADLTVLTDVPFGFGNIKNLEAIIHILNKGKKVYILKSSSYPTIDYTMGQASILLDKARKLGAEYIEEDISSLFSKIRSNLPELNWTKSLG